MNATTLSEMIQRTMERQTDQELDNLIHNTARQLEWGQGNVSEHYLRTVIQMARAEQDRRAN